MVQSTSSGPEPLPSLGPDPRGGRGPGGQGPPGGRGGVVGAEPQPGLGASRAGAPLERETGVSPGPRVLRYRERFIPNMQEDQARFYGGA